MRSFHAALATPSLIEQAKAELLLTNKSGQWYAAHLGSPGHWTNAWNLLTSADTPPPAPPPPPPPSPPPPPPPTSACTKTLIAPGSVSTFVGSLTPGQVGCLSGTFAENVTVRNSGFTLTSASGQTAALKGRLIITDSANDVTISHLFLDARTVGGGILPSPQVNGDRVTFSYDEVTSFNEGFCFAVGNTPEEGPWGIAYDVVIERSRIHNCGVLPPQNHQHGIYADAPRNLLIRDNYIYDNADRGIQLYPDSQGTLVEHNVIDGNGEGIIFGSDVSPGVHTSTNNVVRGNVISNSKVRWLIEAWWNGPIGTGNLVTGNCLWPTNTTTSYNANGGVSNDGGFTATSNLVANPLYVNRAAKDFRLSAGSPCLAYGPR